MHRVKVEFDYHNGMISVSRLDIDLIDYLSDEKYGKYFQEFKDLDLARNLDFWDRMTNEIGECIAAGDDEFFFDINDFCNPLSYTVQINSTDPFYGEIIDGLIYGYTGWKSEYDVTAAETISDDKFKKMEEEIISELIAPAADAGCTFAELLMGDYYYYSDNEMAQKYYRKAAKGGLISCSYPSVSFSWWEPGFNFSFEAFQILNEAAAYGDLNAQLDAAVCFLKGFGVEKDIVMAADIAWNVLKGDLGGNSKALWILGKVREETAKTPADLKAAFEMYRDASYRWDAEGVVMCDLARCYKNGIGTPADEEEAFSWYETAANHYFIPEAQYQTGLHYERGIGVKKNLGKAARNYYNSACHGHKEGIKAILRCYENGIGVERDEKQAAYWREKAAALMET